MNWIRRWLRGGGLVVDSGASVGEMLLYFAAMPGVRVLAFEPVAAARGSLLESLAANPGFSVVVFDCCLGDRSGKVRIQVAGPQSTLEATWYPEQSYARSEVPMERLDAILAARHLPRVRLWKLDVEGSEVGALRGAAGYLERAAIDAVLVEVPPSRFVEVRDCLRTYRYSLFELDRRGRLRSIEKREKFGNMVALPESTAPPQG